jgi:hypothetical protein
MRGLRRRETLAPLRKIKDLAGHPAKIGTVAAPERGRANAAGPGAELQFSGQREGS